MYMYVIESNRKLFQIAQGLDKKPIYNGFIYTITFCIVRLAPVPDMQNDICVSIFALMCIICTKI